MKFDLKSFFNKKNTVSHGSFSFALIWKKSYKTIFFVCVVFAFAYGWHIWQKSLSGNFWSAEKKQEYLNSQNTGVVFNRKNFEKVIEDVQFRKSESLREYQELRDVFKDY